MSKSRSLRKSTIQKNKAARRKSEGLPRAKSHRSAYLVQMKEWNKFLKKQMLLSHEQAGLPSEIGFEDLQKFQEQIPEEGASSLGEGVEVEVSSNENERNRDSGLSEG